MILAPFVFRLNYQYVSQLQVQHQEPGHKTGLVNLLVSTDIELPKGYRVGIVLKGFTLPTEAKSYLKTTSLDIKSITDFWAKNAKPSLFHRRKEAYAAAKWMQQVGINMG